MAGLNNPFATLLNPDTAQPGTLTGFLARTFGGPSPSATAAGDAVQSIAEDIQRGTPPQKAVVNYFSTPQGAQAFVANPNIMAQIEATIKNITPPTPTAVTTGPGSQTNLIGPGGVNQGTFTQPTTENQNFREQGRVVNTPASTKTTVLGPGGEVKQEITNPPADVQTFQEMAKIAKMPPEELQKFAESNLLVNGRYKIAPIHNAFGDAVGVSVLDTLTGKIMTPDSSGVGPQQPSTNVPGVSTVPNDMRSSDGSVDVSKLVAGKAGMFIGSGFWPQVLGGLNSAMGSFIHPSLGNDAGRIANQQRANLEDFKTAVTLFPETVGRTNKVIDQVRKNLDFGSFTDPLDAVRYALNVHDDIQQSISAAENTIKDMNQPKAVRVQAAKEIAGYQRILRSLPSRGEMVELDKAIVANKIPGLGAKAAIESATGSGKTVIESGKNIVTGKDPTAPTAPKGEVDFMKMSPAELAQVDPKTLNHQQRLQLQQRLKQIFKTQP